VHITLATPLTGALAPARVIPFAQGLIETASPPRDRSTVPPDLHRDDNNLFALDALFFIVYPLIESITAEPLVALAHGLPSRSNSENDNDRSSAKTEVQRDRDEPAEQGAK
jgi:hypothetical protein